MRLRSAPEDFEANTLEAVRGLLGRFFYVGRLHDGEGVYEHWGMARVFGADAAQCAIRASHRMLLSKVLKQPLASLLKDVPASCEMEQLTEQELLTSLANSQPKMLSPSARAHLRSVLNGLWALVESQNNANPQAALPPRQPGQESQPPAGI